MTRKVGLLLSCDSSGPGTWDWMLPFGLPHLQDPGRFLRYWQQTTLDFRKGINLLVHCDFMQ